ncbi:hypothetical protein GXM_10147 [Nostoc sphaeroides CCNUC1]|uniref:Uncharacterized protein n=1 Tax=Nostoc sphaeroides CCNUC1 TaxID=2653204 RepID=A0A5P8WJ58_9NOSO|nr:hypothetical protein GXM_10147 [Nostoc sphaeroides CCNUC1]
MVGQICNQFLESSDRLMAWKFKMFLIFLENCYTNQIA